MAESRDEMDPERDLEQPTGIADENVTGRADEEDAEEFEDTEDLDEDEDDDEEESGR